MKSTVRRLIKPFLYRLFPEGIYQWVQTFSKIRDIRNGVDDEDEMALIPTLVTAGETVVDIGANYALYTVALAKAVGKKGTVHAFEPIPFAYGVLRRIVALMGLKNVRLYQKGCSDKNAPLSFTVPLQSFGGVSAGQSHLSTRNNERPGKGRHFRFNRRKTVVCDVVRIDDFLKGIGEVSFIKVDIEGAEYLALRGAEQVIVRSHPTVLCEINPFFLEGFRIKLEELIRFFTAKGYGLYAFRKKEGILEGVSANEVTEDNYLFIHPDRIARLEGRVQIRGHSFENPVYHTFSS